MVQTVGAQKTETAPSTCSICGSSTARAFRFEEYDVQRCRSCGVEFLHPQPSDDVLATIYTPDYFFRNSSDEERERFQYLKSRSARKSLDLIHKSGSQKTGELLEIGCGTGDFLVEAEREGYTCYGVEFSESAAALAASRLQRGSVKVGTLEHAGFADASFDVVANSDVIEHVRDPLAFAREIRRVLRPGGVALIVTPSLDSWSRLVMQRWWVEYKLEHLFYFNRRAMTELLRKAGFQKVEVVPNVKTLSFDYISGHFQKYPVPLFSLGVKAVGAVVPRTLAHRPIDIVASGMTVIAS